MRRTLCLFAVLAACATVALPALAQQPAAPVIDVVEVAGVVDRPLARYLMERISDAQRRDDVALVVLQIDSGGALKIGDGVELSPLVEAVRDSAVPIAAHVGPRTARAAGGALLLVEAADVVSVGPSARMGPACPADLARRACGVAETERLVALAAANGRTVRTTDQILGATASVEAGLADMVVPGVAELLRRAHDREVQTARGRVRLDVPEDRAEVRFLQPGPIRRFLHTLANPTLVYLLLLGGAMLVVFELFQPGFGVAGVTGGLFLLGAAYGLTVLPAQALGLGVLLAGLVLYVVDVALDRIGLATVVGAVAVTIGSFTFLPAGLEALHVPKWLGAVGSASALVYFGAVMTVVRRARTPISTEVKRQLVGEGGHVRSLLNPEGFVMVDGEIWRARSEDGRRLRVGESVVVSSIDGSVLLVRGEPSPN